ncbi:hypothetical protein AK830_g1998 [Neonectria ditissima]|uniref:L-tryptophan decarboxylase PsiD-like domain-containing protein n=1 Tax=Neonectria ditissima TaxID=78410 RepID=A0A0P7BT26_9HYPO|nr:hypothetical protein AK830_g1998 [Neonectria ditissima]
MTVFKIPRQRGDSSLTGWFLPKDIQILSSWLRRFTKELETRQNTTKRLHPVVEDLKVLIESTPELRMLASGMFDEVPDKDPYRQDPIGHKQVRDYKHMLELFSVITTEVAPSWQMTTYNVGLVGAPFNAILDWPMGTRSGFSFFTRPDVNKKLKAILDTWRDEVLSTRKSQYVVTTEKGGWLCKEAVAVIEKDTNVDGQPWYTFQDMFVCDPTGDRLHWGFRSWNDFFVRRFRDMDKFRPVAHPNKHEWVVNACESMPYGLESNVSEYDKFWLKGHNYSVAEMLHHHDFTSAFVGGTVYQAFLSATSYHRWSSPVTGQVVYAGIINGTYFSEPITEGFENPNGPDPSAPNRSQTYLPQVATRAVIFIQAPEPIGLMCIIFIGMADISTCEIASRFCANLPQPVAKGEELGMFHHGGSSHCLLFRKGVKLAWSVGAIPGKAKKNLPIRSELAMAYKDAEIM